MRIHTTSRRRAFVAMTVVGLAATLALPSPAGGAGAVPTTEPVPISDTNPLPAEGADGHCGTGARAQDWENDNELVADPARVEHLVAAWTQDFNDGIVVGYSTNDGRSWKRSLPKTTACTWRLNGDTPPTDPFDFKAVSSTIDPSVAMGPSPDPSPKAITYLTSIVLGAVPGEVTGASKSTSLVHRSLDGGRTWSDPTVLDTAALGDCGGCTTIVDQTDVLADPSQPGHAYATWFKFDAKLGNTDVFMSHTSDGGETWSKEPIQITHSPPGVVAGAPQLAVLPTGELVVVYAQILLSSLTSAALANPVGPTTLWARTSDGGDNSSEWSDPVLVAVADPERLTSHRIAWGPDGTVYVAWHRAAPGGGAFNLMYSASNDGKSWSEPASVGNQIESPPRTSTNRVLAAPAMAVAEDNTVGIAFYDHRNDPDKAPITTDYWLRTMDADGKYLGERHIAGPFDRTTAPDSNGRREGDPCAVGELRVEGTECYAEGSIGDYEGMTRLDGGFGLSFVVARPLPGANFELSHEPVNGNAATDVLFVRIGL